MSDDRRCRTVGLRRPGVTLVELLVVILVMLMITAVTIPAIRPALEGRKIREAARMVEVFLNGARNRAIASGHSVGVLIEPDPNEPSQCISLSYVEQPGPYSGDYQSSTIIALGNGGFGAWTTPPHFDAMGTFVPGVVAGDAIFPQADIGWIQNIAPGDLFFMGNDDTVLYRLCAGEPYTDVNGDGQYTNTASLKEPYNDVDGSGSYTPPDPSIIDPISGFFTNIPPITWGTPSAFVTYTFADPSVAVNYMSATGSYYTWTYNAMTGTYTPIITFCPIYLELAQNDPRTPYYISKKSSLDPGSGIASPTHAFQFNRRPIPSSSTKLNLPDSTCIDLGANYIDPVTKNIVGVPGSGLDILVPFSSGVNTLGNYASFRPNPLTDHEVVGNSATTLVKRPIMITFDPSGIVDRVYSFDERHFIPDATAASLAKPINFTDYQGRLATSPIYLLIGQQELVDGNPEMLPTLSAGTAPLKPIFNMQDPTSLWVSINPRTGLISTTENVPVDLTAAPPTTQTAASPQIQLYFNAQVYQARTFAREASDMGGM